jgi:hypothetical protein
VGTCVAITRYLSGLLAMEADMDTENKESLFEQVKEKLKELAGLPPGRPPTDAEIADDAKSPHGTLTADDAEGLPPHDSTGVNPTE